MFASHFFAGLSLVMVVLDRLFLFGRQKKVVSGHVKQVVILYSNNCVEIRLGGLSIGCLRRMVVLQRWLSEHVCNALS